MAFAQVYHTHCVTQMPAYTMEDKFINPVDLMKELLSTQVLIYFNLRHYTIQDKDNANKFKGNSFSAYITQVKILQKVDSVKPAYKSKLLKGPITSSKSEGKKRQLDDVEDKDVISERRQ